MKQLTLTTEKLKKAFCSICSISARLSLISLSSVLSAATVDDLTFTLINEGTEYAVTDSVKSATGSLTIPDTYEGKPVTEIGAEAFFESQLTAIELPSGLRSIGEDAFGSTLIESIDLPATLTRIDSLAFNFSKLKSISLPAGLTFIGKFAFAYCGSLTGSVTIPSGITVIPDSLFYSTDLTEVIFHDAVTSIEQYSFDGAHFTSLRLPASLTNLGFAAFRYTYNLAEVRFEGAAPSLGVDVFSDAGSSVAGGTQFYIYDTYESSYQNSAGWSGFTFAVLENPNAPMLEAFVLTTSLDASNNRFAIHSHGEPSDASASVLVQHRSSLTAGDWTAVASADVTESRDSDSGVVTRSLTLSPSAEGGFYRLHFGGSE